MRIAETAPWRCFGCRAILGEGRCLSDGLFYTTSAPEGFHVEIHECERCGVPDVFIVRDLAPVQETKT